MKNNNTHGLKNINTHKVSCKVSMSECHYTHVAQQQQQQQHGMDMDMAWNGSHEDGSWMDGTHSYSSLTRSQSINESSLGHARTRTPATRSVGYPLGRPRVLLRTRLHPKFASHFTHPSCTCLHACSWLGHGWVGALSVSPPRRHRLRRRPTLTSPPHLDKLKRDLTAAPAANVVVR